MTIECYFKTCKNHSVHEQGEDGPFCAQAMCTATEKEIEGFTHDRQVELKLLNMNASKKDKKYPVPQELQDLMTEAGAYEELRDIYASRPFGFKKAVRCSKEASKMRKEFWVKSVQLYPELLNEQVEYSHYNGELEIKK